MNILLTGSTGRLGGAFLSAWNKDKVRKCINPGRKEFDLAKPDELREKLKAFWQDRPFDVLINSAAISGLEECLDAPALAQAVNVDSPQMMAEFCAEKGIKMVHFSTDYVFSGEEGGMKVEVDLAEAINVYGKSKRDGELKVLNAFSGALVCRVSWLFGPGRPSFFDQVITSAIAGKEQKLIADKYSVPTFTGDVVVWVEALLDEKCSGIYHLCNQGGPESWMSYGVKICKLAEELGYPIKEKGGSPTLIPMSIEDAHFFREKRPVHTAMSPSRMIAENIATPRCWEVAAKEYLEMRLTSRANFV